MLYLFIIFGVIATVFIFFFLLARFEKEYLVGDMQPRNLAELTWSSEYLNKKIKEAKDLGFIHCGDYFTRTHTSLVKGVMSLYLSPDGSMLLALISGRFLGSETRLSTFRTAVTEDDIIETSDAPFTPDISERIKREIFYDAPLRELLQKHQERLDDSSFSFISTSAKDAFSLFEKIELARGKRLVDAGLAYWCDPSQTTIRRTFRGALKLLKGISQQKDQIKGQVRPENKGYNFNIYGKTLLVVIPLAVIVLTPIEKSSEELTNWNNFRYGIIALLLLFISIHLLPAWATILSKDKESVYLTRQSARLGAITCVCLLLILWFFS